MLLTAPLRMRLIIIIMNAGIAKTAITHFICSFLVKKLLNCPIRINNVMSILSTSKRIKLYFPYLKKADFDLWNQFPFLHVCALLIFKIVFTMLMVFQDLRVGCRGI